MTKTTARVAPMVQMYDKVRVREYIKILRSFIFSWEETVRTDRISSELILDIQAEKTPDKIYLNGKLLPPPNLENDERSPIT